MTAKERAEAHWDGYVGPMMETMMKCMMDMSRFHYISSHVHGSKHGIEDVRDRAEKKGAEHPNSTKDLFTRGCPTCLDAAACAKAMTTDTRGKCLFHRPSLRENMLDAKQEAAIASKVDCADCDSATCSNAGFPMHMERCGGYKAKQEAPTAAVLPLDFTLPSIALKCTAEEAWAKFCSEDDEWMAAKEGSLHELVERWDCLQALYTFYQRGGDVAAYQCHVRTVMEDLVQGHAEGRDIMEARRGMLLKNAKRGYYSPEVNAAIIASKGYRFQPLDEMGVI